MAARKITDEQILELHARHNGSTVRMARDAGITTRALATRMRSIGIPPLTPGGRPTMAAVPPTVIARRPHGRIDIDVTDGVVLVGSDAHYFPGTVSTAHRAFVKMCRELRPSVVIMNGDIFDGASISRHPRIGWDDKPTVAKELQAVTERLTEIEDVCKGVTKLWPMGNHDARFETYLAANAAAYEGVQGFSLKHHYPNWQPCWGVWINQTCVIKHRARGGIHATRNNTLAAGVTMVTGHLHSLKVTPLSDYNGTRWGVDTGTLADPYGEQFADYTELNPVDWRSGFAVLTFHKGRLLYPELVMVHDEGVIDFRGKLIEI
jgi:hypothetical protein